MPVIKALFLLMSICITQTVTGNISCFQYDRGGCWDFGFESGVHSASACQKACTLRPQCEAFLYSPKTFKCHFCSETSAVWENNGIGGCNEGDNCVYGPVKCPHSTSSQSVSDILESSLLQAQYMCDVFVAQDNVFEHAINIDLLEPASFIHQIVKNRDVYGEELFSEAYGEAVENAIKILPTLQCARPCAGILKLQLESMVFWETLNGALAFPNDVSRAKLLDDFRVLMADNGFLSNDSLEAIYRVYDMLPYHLRPRSLEDASFVVQYIPGTFNCEWYDEGLVDFTNVTYSTSPALQWNVTSSQSFPIDTPMMPPPGDALLTSVKHDISTRFNEVVGSNPRLWSMLNFLYVRSKEGNHARHWLGTEGPEFFEKNPREILADQIGRQYMFSSSSQLGLAVSRWGSFNVDSIVSVMEGHKCDKIDKNLGDNITSRLSCRREALDNEACSGDFYMWDEVRKCSCCSASAHFIKDNDWSVHRYRTNEAPQVPTALPLSWWLLNVDILTDIETSTSTFYEYNSEGEVVPICVNVMRDDNGRIETIEVPGCGLLDFNYSIKDEFLVDAVTDNVLACRPLLTQNVCANLSKDIDQEVKPETPPKDKPETPQFSARLSGAREMSNSQSVIFAILLMGVVTFCDLR